MGEIQSSKQEYYLNTCEICNHLLRSHKEMFVSDPFAVTSQLFRLVQCKKCETYVLNPRPLSTEMSKYYQSDFLFDSHKRSKGFIGGISNIIQKINLCSEINWVSKFINKKRSYLDFSAGNGQILLGVQKRFPTLSIFATEFSEAYKTYLKKYLPSKNIKDTLANFEADQKFDVISAFGVLEHVENPRELLLNLKSRLSKTGVLLLSVPNPKSIQAKIGKEKWYSWIAPRHFNLMPMHTLRHIVSEQGFSIIEEKHFFLRTNPSSFVLTLFPSLDPLKPQSSLKTLLYGMLFYIFVPIELLLSTVKCSGFMGLALRNSELRRKM